MYVGRLLVAGPGIGAYRVSSRSFPNRKIIVRDGAHAVVPTDAASETDNPYVSYHCLRSGDGRATIGNGSHVDPIAEKLELGYPARDALATGLLTLDYEKDDYQTPRIAAVIAESTTIGIVRSDAVLVQEVDEPHLVATYEKAAPEPIDVGWQSAAEAAESAYDLAFEHPICATAVALDPDGATTAIYNGDTEC